MSLIAFLYAGLKFNYIRNNRQETACASQRNLKVKKGCLLTKLRNTGCASAQKRKTDFLSKVMTDSASSCCFCHGSSWFQIGRPDLPSITTTSRQRRDLALMSVQVWAYRDNPLQWYGLCCSLSCLWPHSDECQPQKWEERGAGNDCPFLPKFPHSYAVTALLAFTCFTFLFPSPVCACSMKSSVWSALK